MRHVARFLATVGGLGRIRWAPGTWGSLVGLLLGVTAAHAPGWPATLILVGAAWVLGAVIASAAERQLGRRDPPAIILDELVGMATVFMIVPRTANSWLLTLLAFVLFRIFDITKPPPLRRLERLPAGWGVMADDLGASAYTIGTLWLILKMSGVVHSR